MAARTIYKIAADSKIWMIIFLDLITLLLTFFVLLYSMTTVPSKTSNVDGREGDQAQDLDTFYGGPDKTINEAGDGALSLTYIASVFENKIKEGSITGITIKLLPKGLVISLDTDSMFAGGQAVIIKKSEPALTMLARTISNLPNDIAIEGHSDPRPINTVEFASNTELALARAIAVGSFLINSGMSMDFNIYSRSEGDFKEISEDLPTDERYKRARRVDIIILPEEK